MTLFQCAPPVTGERARVAAGGSNIFFPGQRHRDDRLSRQRKVFGHYFYPKIVPKENNK